jgi:hypothetical protein
MSATTKFLRASSPYDPSQRLPENMGELITHLRTTKNWPAANTVVLGRKFPEPLYKLIVSNPAYARIDLYCKANLGGDFTPERARALLAKYCLKKGIRDFYSPEAESASFEDVADVLCPPTPQAFSSAATTPPEPARPQISDSGRTVTWKGETHRIQHREAFLFFKTIAAAEGEIVRRADFPFRFQRRTRLRALLPPTLNDLIESKKGNGGGYRLKDGTIDGRIEHH